MSPSGIEPTTIRLLAQCLSQLRHLVPRSCLYRRKIIPIRPLKVKYIYTNFDLSTGGSGVFSCAWREWSVSCAWREWSVQLRVEGVECSVARGGSGVFSCAWREWSVSCAWRDWSVQLRVEGVECSVARGGSGVFSCALRPLCSQRISPRTH
jgi:hypothetical protein